MLNGQQAHRTGALAGAAPAHYLHGMTENRNLAEELLRGGVAVAGFAMGIYLLQSQPILAAAPFIAAIIAIRGCAFCYLFGLFGAARACAVRVKPQSGTEQENR